MRASKESVLSDKLRSTEKDYAEQIFENNLKHKEKKQPIRKDDRRKEKNLEYERKVYNFSIFESNFK